MILFATIGIAVFMVLWNGRHWIGLIIFAIVALFAGVCYYDYQNNPSNNGRADFTHSEEERRQTRAMLNRIGNKPATERDVDAALLLQDRIRDGD